MIEGYSKLEMYENIFGKMNAVTYIVNLDPYKVIWISDNARVRKGTGETPEEIISLGVEFPKRLVPVPDFEESVTTAVNYFKYNTDAEWTGLYRIQNPKQNTQRWVLYTASIFEVVDGLSTKAVIVAIDITDQFQTDEVFTLLIKQQLKNQHPELFSKLTKRQLTIVKMVANGKSSKDIADELSISFHTVESHRSNILSRLGIKTTAQLISMAENSGLLI